MLLRDRAKIGKKLLMELHLETQQLSSIENDSSIIVKMFKFLDENVCIIIKLFIL